MVELMVALVIGMLGVVIMMQVFGAFEGQRRTTVSGDDAISGGAVSIYGLQRIVRQSGWGLSSPQLIGCSVSGLLAGGVSVPLVPVTINPEVSAGVPMFTGQDPNTDTLLVISGNGNGSVEGDEIQSAIGGTSYAVRTSMVFSVGDRVLAVPRGRPATCNLVLASVTSVVSPSVSVGTAAGYAVGVGDRLFNLGSAPVARAYAVRSRNLTMCDFTVNDCSAAANNGNASVWVPVANNVVSLKVQYGRDTTVASMDGIVDVWDKTTASTACGFLRTSAIRMALVARSSQPEKTADWRDSASNTDTHITANAPLWAGSDAVADAINHGEAVNAAIDLSDSSLSPGGTAWPTWRDFRYKVFQTVVPLRNITIQGAISTC